MQKKPSGQALVGPKVTLPPLLTAVLSHRLKFLPAIFRSRNRFRFAVATQPVYLTLREVSLDDFTVRELRCAR
jgi:hypothetical protein